MIKLRQAGYCNLKLLLIYLVVYGHWIEAGIRQSPALMMQYRWIYLVHMPLFAFLSGLFLRTGSDCLRQLRRMLPMYLLLQTVAVLLSGGAVRPLTPYWHLWFLLSCCVWMGTGFLWFRFCGGRGGLWIPMAGILLGCGAGYVSWIGRPLSLSRTLVFFPYFWAGLLCRPDFPWQKLRPWGLCALLLAVILMWDRPVSVVFLYHAAPYGKMAHGGQTRLLCYLVSSLLCLFLLTFVPDRRFFFTRMGADTMPVYLLHGPLVLRLRELPLPWPLCPVLAAWLTCLICKSLQWHSALYGVIPGERRFSLWFRFRKFTKNTESRYIGSCCP